MTAELLRQMECEVIGYMVDLKPIPKQIFTREELISLLEEVYAIAAGSYNNYGISSGDYLEDARIFVEEFMRGNKY